MLPSVWLRLMSVPSSLMLALRSSKRSMFPPCSLVVVLVVIADKGNDIKILKVFLHILRKREGAFILCGVVFKGYRLTPFAVCGSQYIAVDVFIAFK